MHAELTQNLAYPLYHQIRSNQVIPYLCLSLLTAECSPACVSVLSDIKGVSNCGMVRNVVEAGADILTGGREDVGNSFSNHSTGIYQPESPFTVYTS